MAVDRCGDEGRVARKAAAIGAFPLVLALVSAGAVFAEPGQPGLEEDTAPETTQLSEDAADKKSASVEVAAAGEGTVVLAATSAPLVTGPAPLTAEEQAYIENGERTGQIVGAAAAGAPAATVGAIAGGAIGTAVAGPFGTIPGAVVGGVAGGAIFGAIGASYGYETGGEVGAEIAEDQVRGDDDETLSTSESFGDTVAGIPLLAP